MTASTGAAFYAAMSALKAVCPGIKIIAPPRATVTTTSCEPSLPAPRDTFARMPRPRSSRKPSAKFTPDRSGRRAGCWQPSSNAPPQLARKVQPQTDDKISEREREVLRLLVSGCSDREIADELGIEERTGESARGPTAAQGRSAEPNRAFGPRGHPFSAFDPSVNPETAVVTERLFSY